MIELNGTSLNISTQKVNVDPIFTFWYLLIGNLQSVLLQIHQSHIVSPEGDHKDDNRMLCRSPLAQVLQPQICLDTFANLSTNLNQQGFDDKIVFAKSSIS